MSQHWIKLYLEILTDPKMGTLDDITWRRTIELFLIASKYDQAGDLPVINNIAWTLRTTEDEILSVLLALEQIGITSRDEAGNWRVTNFARRQAALSNADRSRMYRQRCAAHGLAETPARFYVTEPRAENAPDTDSDKDTDKDSEPDSVCDTHIPAGDEQAPAFDEQAPMGDQTPGQTYFARAYKTQPTRDQLLGLAQLENAHGYPRLTEVIDWAVKSGIPPGRALRAIRTAIPAWSDHPSPPRNAPGGRLTGALDKLRKELSGDFDS